MGDDTVKHVAWSIFALAFVVIASLMLAGCGPSAGAGPSISLTPVCDALGAPIRFNPHNKDSVWHAGSSLAKRIVQQDDVGANLRCKGYD